MVTYRQDITFCALTDIAVRSQVLSGTTAGTRSAHWAEYFSCSPKHHFSSTQVTYSSSDIALAAVKCQCVMPQTLTSLGRALVENGHPVLFIPVARLVERLLEAKRDLRLARELKRLDNFDCLALDRLRAT